MARECKTRKGYHQVWTVAAGFRFRHMTRHWTGKDQTRGLLSLVNNRKVLETEFNDRTRPVGTDRTLGGLCPVNSSKVIEWVFLDRTLVRVRSELNGSF